MQHHFIANEQQPSSTGRTLPVIDPSDGQPFDEIQRGTADDLDRAVKAARRCYDGTWSKLSAAERGRLLMRLSQKVADHAEELALLEQRDCGKPTRQARADAAALARYFEYYAGACDKLHGETIPFLDGYSVLTWREPHGVTGHVIPWNYPMQIFGRSVGGSLAAGNVYINIIADDCYLTALQAHVVQRDLKKIRRGFAYDHSLGAACIFQPMNEGTNIQLQAMFSLPETVFMNGDQPGALHQMIEHLVQQRVSPGGTNVADHYVINIGI